MNTQHWRITLEKEGARVFLFTTTTDDTVQLDLDGDSTHSLIRRARQFHRHPQTEEQNHRDLAIGAIMAYATEPPFVRSGAQLARIDAVPDAAPTAHIGGGRHCDLVPIWEEAEETFEEESGAA